MCYCRYHLGGRTSDGDRALALHVRGLVEDGEQIPAPSTLDDLANDPGLRKAVAVLIPLRASEKTVRVNITARESQLKRIDRLAKKAGLTRSAYIVQAATSGFANPRRRTRQTTTQG